MKKNFFYAMMSAIALTGAVSFSSCSSSDELTDVNPTYDGESVKTSFTISIGDVTNPTTRMEANPVQKNQDFQGMTDIYLFPFISSTDVDGSSTINESYIHLANFDAFDNNVAKGKIYNDVSLSVGVNKFLFYGATQDPGNGKLKASYLSMSDNKWATGFKEWAPTPIVKGTSKVGVYTTTPINGLTFDLVPIKRGWTLAGTAATSDTPATQALKTDDGATKTIAPLNAVDIALAAQITAATEANTEDSHAGVIAELTKLQKTLRNDISTTTTPNYKFYAGSSNSILSLMTMLYNTLKNNAAAYTKGSNYATAIATAIENYFNAPTPDPATDPYALTWKTDPKFPTDLGLPEGAATVQYTGTSETAPFEYVKPTISGLTVPDINNYTYPASLYYRVKTNAMVKGEEYLETHKSDNWETITAAYTAGAVTASTRSVIMEDPVQYAVGRLDVYVRVKENAIILDNSKEAAQPVTVPGGGYRLTGVLIGGQKQVGYDFTPISSAAEMTIWDNIMTGSTANSDVSPILAVQGTSFSEANHTLALETAANATVNIALEFENTGNDFCGIDNNLIPAGTKFYLVAKLNPGAGTPTVNPNPNNLNQVFKQDYITSAYLVINETSLQKAYNVVPDLRSPKLEFGLSVNLVWQPGITFNIEF